jgi:uncharacterized protein
MWALVLGRGGFEPPKALGQLIYSQSRLTASVSARPGDFTDNRPVGKRRWILWQGLIAPSMERFVAARTESGCQLSGLILQAHQDAPYVVRYSIDVDDAWRTRAVQIEVENDGRHQTALVTDGTGHWSRDGAPLAAAENCLDVDLEWSPWTNTLPIRRLGLALGETKTVAATWVRFPSLEVQRLDQSYERLDERRYRYRSGRFTADLAVDEDGVVLQYGVNWKAVATSGELG